MSSASAGTSKTRFPKSMAFQKVWRAYQKRLLDQLDSYLDDRRFHLVAAPGSGKTVLGLEVIRRIGQPTLVLAPTITIRNQWVDRLVDYFLPAGQRPSWVSTDLRAPALLTIATYQALHSLCFDEPDKEPDQPEEEESSNHLQLDANHDVNGDSPSHDANESLKAETARQLPNELAAAGFRTLVVDEAHHLRAEWWKTLTFVVEHLNRPTIVALTATPPYDVSPFEWQRYEQLCGPVDAQVSIPELVSEGDLCPHQDYVYFTLPAEKEQKELSDFRGAVDLFVQRLRSTEAFKDALLTHPWMIFPDSHVEEILGNPEYFSSMLVYVQAAGAEIARDVPRILGLPPQRMPALDLEWLEILLSNCLYADAKSFSTSDAIFQSFRYELLTVGAIEHRKVRLRNPSEHTRLLAGSVTKLKSIEEIVRVESGAQGNRLRCVVLTDFIRKAEMPSQDGEACSFEDIGVVPIFETLRRAGVKDVRLGVLSGSVVLIPSDAEALLRAAATAAGVRAGDLSLTPLRHDPGYSIMELRGEYYQGTVRLMTSVFEHGGITALVGTKSLLGEGWDAPCINTLILASFVGSYVLSNQMRGRSIRVEASDPEKAANIWHLVCVEPGIYGPGEDYELLVRRCRGFVGVSATSTTIDSGTERLGLGHPPFSREQIVQINKDTCRRAINRIGLLRRWQEALASGASKEMVDGLRSPNNVLPRRFVLTNTIPAVLIQSGWLFLALLLQFIRDPSAAGSAPDLLFYAAVAAGAISLPWTLRALWRFVRHGTPERSVREIGRAVLASLIYEGSISPPEGQGQVYANRNNDGTVVCWIDGKGHEQATFVRALSEVLGPMNSPRYLLARRGVGHLFGEDYFAVPAVLARTKECAEVFADNWQRLVGPVRLVHTRTPEGRMLLLRARVHSLAAAFQKRSEHVSCWK